MLSQNRASVLGFSWLRRCLNQRWMVRTSQSNCLDRPSNLFSSGCLQDKTNAPHVKCCTNVMRWNTSLKNNEENTCTTLVMAVKTFSRIALGCAFCGPLAWIFRPMAHGLAINLQLKYHDTLSDQHGQNLWDDFKVNCAYSFILPGHVNVLNTNGLPQVILRKTTFGWKFDITT